MRARLRYRVPPTLAPHLGQELAKLHKYGGMQTFEVVIAVLLILLLLFDVFVPTSAHPLLFLDNWFAQIYLNDNFKKKMVNEDFSKA